MKPKPQKAKNNTTIQAEILSKKWTGKVPKESLELLKGRLAKIEDVHKVQSFGLLQLKSPFLGFVLGLFLGWLGVDRFYKGDMGLGIGKIAAVMCFGIGFIWVIVDLVVVWKGIKHENFEKINNQLLACGV